MSPPSGAGVAETVAVVVVTYNRSGLLAGCLDGLAASERPPDAVVVVDNHSSDGTADLLADRARRGDLPLRVIRTEDNLGGAGGFHRGVAAAYESGYDRIWLMDDDVVPAPGCLSVMMAHQGPALMAVREDVAGGICEKAATDFDLRHPWFLRPKRRSVEQDHPVRSAMPAEVTLENVAFEGFMIRREVVDAVGLPDPGFFIFYDDVDYALRARRAGFAITALRDAVLVRQLDFDQQHDTRSWKGYYMYRNLFVVHLRYGENLLVRLKPYAIAAGVALVSVARGRWDEARNVVRAAAHAPRLARTLPPGPPGHDTGADPGSRPGSGPGSGPGRSWRRPPSEPGPHG